jgi:hypothetical protein
MASAARHATHRADQTTIWVSKRAAGESTAGAVDRVLAELRAPRRSDKGTTGAGARSGAGALASSRCDSSTSGRSTTTDLRRKQARRSETSNYALGHPPGVRHHLMLQHRQNAYVACHKWPPNLNAAEDSGSRDIIMSLRDYEESLRRTIPF